MFLVDRSSNENMIFKIMVLCLIVSLVPTPQGTCCLYVKARTVSYPDDSGNRFFQNTATHLLHGLTSRETLILTESHEKLRLPTGFSYIIKTEKRFIVIQ
jgi:hypothetical protein